MKRDFWQLSVVLMMLLGCEQAAAQSPASPVAVPKEDQATGITLNTAFSGSILSGSEVYDWTTTAGYIFDKHFSADLGMPIFFIRGTSSTGQATSTNGPGDVFAQVQFVEKNAVLNFGSILTGTLPTGDSSKGLSTGRVTFDWTSQVAKRFGRWTPFASVGVANSIFNVAYWNRPYTTLGDLAHFQAGTSFDLGPSLTLSASAYDIAPWGGQKVYSRVVTRSGGAGGQALKHRRVFLDNALTTGGSAIASDNGFNADLDFHPRRYVNFDFAYSHSAYFQLDAFSFGVGFNLSPWVRR